ncbi:MAG TPA: peptidoglycan DD-metalloendopeptidase family protein, partial [Pyrinomonadaceae bacterium]|nr:peptidoglycan DD-metalloendopeptidase family protein [Pyrinomonadaceae bacterium]
MNLSPLEQINNLQTKPNAQSPEAIRNAAMQFEAVLLMQLTAALSNTGGDDEDSLFGSDGGSGLAKQMFSEQLATTMAESGGVGLSNLIMQQFGANQPKSVSGNPKNLSNVMAAVKDIKENSPQNFNNPVNSISNLNQVETEMNSTVGDSPETQTPMDNSVNLSRSRIIPEVPINEIASVSREFGNSGTNSVSEKVMFRMPVKGRISSGFGNRFHPIDKKVKFHAGVDIAVPLGTPVSATGQGIVTFAGSRDGYGNMVIIQHPDGRESRYGHLSKILVSQGETIAAGQQIALSGSTGKSTGPHLHFEIRERGEVVNPFKILSNVLPETA